MTKTTRVAVGLAVLVLALHVPFLPSSLEDLDSFNFALGLRHFDVAQHQPHPPGYPVYIAVGRLVHLLVDNEARALALVSLLSAAVVAYLLLHLFNRLMTHPADRVASGAAMLAVTSPLFWITAVRPLSDMFGLAMALAAQTLVLSAAAGQAPGGLAAAAFVAGLGVGVRSQVVWLTAPLLVMVVLLWARDARLRAAAVATVAFAAGALMWAVPLVVLSGGPGAYLQALASQGGEDFTGVAMLATQPSPRLLLSALDATLLAPWGAWPLGVLVLLASMAGLVRMWRRAPRDLATVFVAFVPYGLFHLVFQETVTTRYALPLVVPFALLAAYGLAGLAALPARAGVSGALPAVARFSPVVLALAGLTVGFPAVRAYAKTPAPALQVLDLWAHVTGEADTSRPVLAMHRRQELDMRRPLLWEQARLPAFAAHLPAPPKHEWLEMVKFWNANPTFAGVVYFLADPPRSDLRLIDRHALQKVGEFRWPFDATALLGGVRPNVMDFYRISAPAWYAGEGWALTPETAGVARDEGKGPGKAPIQAWVRRHPGAARLMIGGRKLSGAQPTPVTVKLDGRTVWSAPVAPGFFLEFVPLAAGALAGDGTYAALTVESSTDEVAIEQFDVQPADRVVYGYGDGWQELEYNPATGRLWRWSTERAQLRVHSPRQPLTLHLEGEFETSAKTAHVTIRAGDRVLAAHDVPRQFTLDIPVPADVVGDGSETQLTLESDQWYVPAETNWRPTQDRRHLALRIFTSELRPSQGR